MTSTPSVNPAVPLPALQSIGLAITVLRGQHRKYAPFAFTEHGAIMAATVLNSPRAVQVSLYVVRAFVRLREAAVVHQDLTKQLADLQDKTESLAAQHDSFSQTTRAQLKQVFDALRQLMVPPDPPKRPVGFVTPPDKPI